MSDDSSMRQLFCFFQFSGGNEDLCNLKCPYCYGGINKRMIDRWNGRVDDWTNAFERLDRDIYFNLSYGESMVSKGFYPVMDIIGNHPRWEVSLITNLTISPETLLKMRVAQDKRLYVHASWHPLGGAKWSDFKKHLLMLQDANIPTIVMYLFYPPQIEAWKHYFSWLDKHNIRTCVRRFVGEYEGKPYPRSYSKEVWDFLYAMLQPKTRKYGTDLASPQGNLCSASKDMILVHHDGGVGLCADCPGAIEDANIFNPSFKLNMGLIRCPTRLCGGD